MNPSTIGWVAASLLVPIGAVIAITKRKTRTPGVVQRYPKVSKILMFTLAILALAVSVYLVIKGPGETRVLKHWAAVVIAFVAGIGGMIGAYFYGTYSITATPDSITVVHAFHGTHTITRNNIISADERYFKGVRYLDVAYREEGQRRKIHFDRARFDLSAFFGSRA